MCVFTAVLQLVSTEFKEQLNKASDLFHPKGDFKNYRRHIKNSKSARHGHYIPFLSTTSSFYIDEMIIGPFSSWLT